MQEIVATLDNDTAGELHALAAAVGMLPEALAAAFILEGVERHTHTHNGGLNVLEGFGLCDDSGDGSDALQGHTEGEKHRPRPLSGSFQSHFLAISPSNDTHEAKTQTPEHPPR